MTATQELNQAGRYELSHLRSLEAEAIHIIREVAAEFERPVLLFSGGKDVVPETARIRSASPVFVRALKNRQTGRSRKFEKTFPGN